MFKLLDRLFSSNRFNNPISSISNRMEPKQAAYLSAAIFTLLLMAGVVAQTQTGILNRSKESIANDIQITENKAKEPEVSGITKLAQKLNPFQPKDNGTDNSHNNPFVSDAPEHQAENNDGRKDQSTNDVDNNKSQDNHNTPTTESGDTGEVGSSETTNATPTPQPTATNTPQPTPTATPVATPNPSPTPTSTPTPSPSPTATTEPAALPDLVITNVYIYEPPMRKAHWTAIMMTIENQGDDDYHRLSNIQANFTDSQGGTTACEMGLPDLGPGESVETALQCIVYESGPAEATIKVDDNNAITESNEDNNIYEMTINIAP